MLQRRVALCRNAVLRLSQVYCDDYFMCRLYN